MKKLIGVFLVLVCFSSLVFSQPKVTIVKKSASALSVGSYDVNGNFTNNDLTLRFAIEPKISFSNSSSFSARAGYNTNEKNFLTFWYDQAVSDVTSFRIGFFGRPIGFLNRPHPASAAAHFETSGTNQIPGATSAIMLTHKTGGVTLYQGLYYNQQRKIPELSFGASGKVGSSELRGGVVINNEQQGFAITTKSELFSLTGYYETEKVHSGVLEIYTNVVDPYITFAVDRKLGKETDLEFGFTKTFSLSEYQKEAAYCFGAGYNTVSKTANIYLWIYVE